MNCEHHIEMGACAECKGVRLPPEQPSELLKRIPTHPKQPQPPGASVEEFEERWFAPDKNGNDFDLACALEADSLTADFVADVRALFAAAEALRAERDQLRAEIERLRMIADERGERLVPLTVECNEWKQRAYANEARCESLVRALEERGRCECRVRAPADKDEENDRLRAAALNTAFYFPGGGVPMCSLCHRNHNLGHAEGCVVGRALATNTSATTAGPGDGNGR